MNKCRRAKKQKCRKYDFSYLDVVGRLLYGAQLIPDRYGELQALIRSKALLAIYTLHHPYGSIYVEVNEHLLEFIAWFAIYFVEENVDRIS